MCTPSIATVLTVEKLNSESEVLVGYSISQLMTTTGRDLDDRRPEDETVKACLDILSESQLRISAFEHFSKKGLFAGSFQGPQKMRAMAWRADAGALAQCSLVGRLSRKSDPR
jgi:hypothetical protein